MTEKICTSCERSLPLSSYHRKGDGYQARCRDCRKVSVKEPLTYEQNSPHSFFRDLLLAKVDKRPDARQRIERHEQETRDVAGTSGGGAQGVLPPGYLSAEYAGLPRAPRSLADRVAQIPMPEYGDSFTVPVLSGGTAVAVQSNENDGVQETNVTSNQTISAPVVTLAGQQDVSIQSLRSATPGFDTVIYADLMKAYNTKLDSELLNGSGSGLNHLGIRNVSGAITQTFTSATPTPELFIQNLSKLVGQVSSQRYANELLVLLAPRRAAWLSQASGTASLSDLPSFDQFGFNIEFAVDPNIVTNLGAGTNQDQAYVVVPSDLILAEQPMQIRAPEVLSGTLEVRLALYSYSLFISWRAPKGVGILDGSGMSNPGGYS